MPMARGCASTLTQARRREPVTFGWPAFLRLRRWCWPHPRPSLTVIGGGGTPEGMLSRIDLVEDRPTEGVTVLRSYLARPFDYVPQIGTMIRLNLEADSLCSFVVDKVTLVDQRPDSDSFVAQVGLRRVR